MRMKLRFTIGILILAVAPMVSAQTNVGKLTDGLSSFVNNTAPSLPFAAGAGLDWSDAYIGQVVDTSFPFTHFGFGLTGGVTSIPTKAVNPLLEALGQPDVSSMGIPFTNFNLRVGGLVWPFDFGLKIGFLPSGVANGSGYAFTYNNIGFDLRYSLVKSDLWMPDVSVGGGLSYLSATAKGTYGNSVTYTDPNSNQLTVSAPTLNLKMSSLEFEGKVQVSKTLFFILTPYLGLNASFGTAHTEAGATAQVSATNGVSNWTSYVPGITSTGFSTSADTGVFGMKLYGGTSFNLVFIRLDLQGMYSLFSGDYGGSLGLRFQL